MRVGLITDIDAACVWFDGNSVSEMCVHTQTRKEKDLAKPKNNPVALYQAINLRVSIVCLSLRPLFLLFLFRRNNFHGAKVRRMNSLRSGERDGNGKKSTPTALHPQSE